MDMKLFQGWKKCTLCIIAMLLVFAMVIRTFTFGNKSELQLFRDTLNEKQLLTYNNIIEDRKTIYYTGTVIGFILTGLYLLWNKFMRNKKSSSKCSWVNACIAVVIMSFVTYFYYMLTPKTDYMILHLKTSEQHHEWLNVYKSMQYDYHISFVYSLLAVVTLSYL